MHGGCYNKSIWGQLLTEKGSVFENKSFLKQGLLFNEFVFINIRVINKFGAITIITLIPS